MPVPIALSIGGSDSSGAAGIQADLATFAALGVQAATAITVVTAQGSTGVQRFHELPAELVGDQIGAVLGDHSPAATKTGLLRRTDIIHLVSTLAPELGALVVDPVCTDSTGVLIVEHGALDAYRELIATATVSTPNRWELEQLLDVSVSTADDVITAAPRVRELGTPWIVVTGGRGDERTVVDVVIGPDDVWSLEAARRVVAGSVRGTGCTFAAAITAGLAQGNRPDQAIRDAHRFVQDQLALLDVSRPVPGRPGLPHWAPIR